MRDVNFFRTGSESLLSVHRWVETAAVRQQCSGRHFRRSKKLKQNLFPFSDPSDILTHDPDDFIIGDRVWVNGTKPGYIQFIGETKFAAGDWAGIVLDEPIGKNDGSVSGVRYFQCEPRRGVFARLQRLTRYPMSGHNSANDSTLIQEAPGKSITTRVSTAFTSWGHDDSSYHRISLLNRGFIIWVYRDGMKRFEGLLGN